MWWNLPKLGRDKFESLRESQNAILAAWSSQFGNPQLVGLWRIKKDTFASHPKNPNRFECQVSDEFSLSHRWLGARLRGDGKSYQGPKISLP
jgi:hypothetical protein